MGHPPARGERTERGFRLQVSKCSGDATMSRAAAAERDRPNIGRREMFRALRYRDYRLFWIGQLAGVMGQNMQHVAMYWLVLELTGSPLMVGLTGLSNAVPGIAFSFLGGALADRTDRLRLLVWAQVAQALLYLGLGVLVSLHLAEVWHAMAFAFLAGFSRAFDEPARQAFVPHLVPLEARPHALALSGTVWQFSRLVGPALAGVLIAAFGTGSAFYAASAGFLVCLTLLIMIRTKPPLIRAGEKGILSDLFEGVRFIRQNDLFYTFIGMTFFNSVFGMSYTVLLPVIARDILGVDSRGYGLLQTASGLGALAGTLVVAYMANSGRRGLQAIVGATLFGLLICAFSFSSWYPLSLAIILLMGMANQLYMTTIYTILQLHVPDELRGRVMGVYGLTWRLTPFGGTISGTIAEFAGVQAAIGLGGLMVAGMALTVAAKLPRVRRLQ